ncbi:MAG: hypothetical protein GY820_25725, partial [Gammaproteobacteria bacterium]|nr:hypothetical protein [Gammaproteobacteria bacterium]
MSIIKKVMDQAMVKGMLDALAAQLKADSQVREDAAKAERELKEAAEKAERDTETLKQREDRIRDKQELRDYVKNFVSQFVDTGDHNNAPGSSNTQVHSSVPIQSQGALGMGPCHSGTVSNGDQTSKRGRSKDRGASQD